MKRATSILSATSATLAALLLVLIAASFVHQIYLRLPSYGPHGAAMADNGAISIIWDAPPPAPAREYWWKGWGLRSVHAFVMTPPSPQRWPIRILGINLCLPLLAFSILPALSYGRRLRQWQRTRARLRSGQCTQCGYDLRASNDRCPECGTAIPAGALDRT